MAEHTLIADHDGHEGNCGGTKCTYCGCCVHCAPRCWCKVSDAPEGMSCPDRDCGCEGRM